MRLANVAGLLALLAVSSMGCMGGQYRIIASTLPKPVSATGVVFDQHGKAIARDTVQVVHRFDHTVRHWSILWTIIDLSPGTHDISAQLTQEMTAHGGDAIVNLKVTVENANGLYNFFGFLPFVPTVVVAHVKGDVVKVERGATAAAPPPAPPG